MELYVKVSGIENSKTVYSSHFNCLQSIKLKNEKKVSKSEFIE